MSTRQSKFNTKEIIFIGLGLLSTSIAWSFYNFKIPIILNGIEGEFEGTWTRVGLLGTGPWMEILGGAIMTLDNIVAIFLQPYFGRLSDRMQSKYGRRTPFLILGLTTSAISFSIVPLLPGIGLLIGVIFVFNLGMAFYKTPVLSLLPDKTSKEDRGKANAIINLLGGLGVIIGVLIPAIVTIIPGTTPTVTGVVETQDFFIQDFAGFALTGGFMLICLILYMWQVDEMPTGTGFFHVSKRPINMNENGEKNAVSSKEQKEEPYDEAEEDISLLKELRNIYLDKKSPAFWIVLAAFCYLFGFNALEFSFGRFATSYLQVDEGTASLLLAAMPISIILAALPAGIWSDKYGRLKIMKLGLYIVIFANIFIIIYLPVLNRMMKVRPLTIFNLLPLFIGLFIGGAGYGLTHINALPVLWSVSPKNKLGTYTGIFYMMTSLGQILSPLFMATIFAFVRMSGGNPWSYLFPYFLFGLVFGLLCIFRIKMSDEQQLSREEIKKLRESYSSAD